ncbi:glycosyltransferase [Bosea sp. ASV33]|uniref:glycosyltransferase family 2 protein n=1 Tax=Bosea sp. ASV33 TaxID=2795106 RepID=UPI0018EBD653|nr:glycosyltransferase [Bosea sp. ASV33]
MSASATEGLDRSAVAVSVVIPAFNAAGFIGRAISSVQEQILQDVEIIVVDDCSRDDTVAVVQGLARADPRISLVRSPQNAGPSAARNRGIAAAKGRWIAVLDADDAYAPDRLALLIGLGEEEGLDMVGDDIRYFDAVAGAETGRGGANETGAVKAVTLDGFLVASMFRPSALALTGRPPLQYALLKFIFRRSFIEDSGLRYPEHLRDNEDFHFYARCLIAGAKAALAPFAGYLYTQRVGSLSGRKSGQTRTLVDRSRVVVAVDELLQAHGRDLSSRQLALLRARRSQAMGLGAFEKALALVHERRAFSALRLLAMTPPSWGFVSQALVQRARRTTTAG